MMSLGLNILHSSLDYIFYVKVINLDYIKCITNNIIFSFKWKKNSEHIVWVALRLYFTLWNLIMSVWLIIIKLF